MRKVIQISTVVFPDNSGIGRDDEGHDPRKDDSMLFALCDDGTIWMLDGPNIDPEMITAESWKKIPRPPLTDK